MIATKYLILGLILLYSVIKTLNLNVEYDKRVIFLVLIFIIFLVRIAFLINKALTEYFKIRNEHESHFY